MWSVKRVLSLFMSIIMLTSFFTATQVSADVKKPDSISAEETADKMMRIANGFYGVTGMQYSLIDDDKIILSGQFGSSDLEKKIAIKPDTKFPVASISKVFTTVAVMKLVEEGALELNQPVIKYLPEFTMADERYVDITVRMLLNHSSGLMGSVYKNTLLIGDNDTRTYDNFLKELKTQRLKADPGAFSVYCNDGFTLAELLIEKVAGCSFTEYLSNHISKPLSLMNTITLLDDFQDRSLVKPYLQTSGKSLPYDSLMMIGAGGIYSTAEDLCRFSSIFFQEGFLKKESIDAMGEPECENGFWNTVEDNTIQYGLGWDSVDSYPFNRYGIKALVKGGDTLQCHSSIVVLPDEKIAVAVLSTGSSNLNQIIAQEIIKAYLVQTDRMEITEDVTSFEKGKTVKLPKSFRSYAGMYANRNSFFTVSFDKDGALKLFNTTYQYQGNNMFLDDTGKVKIEFVKKDSELYLYQSQYQSYTNIGNTASGYFIGQKIKSEKLPKKVAAAWKKRDNKRYFLLNEKYTSQFYLFALQNVSIRSRLSQEYGDYYFTAKIIDENFARMEYTIPGMVGRDLSDFRFYKKNNKEYLNSSGRIYLSEDAVRKLTKKTTRVEINSTTGFSKWFRIAKSTGGKQLKVTLPAEGAFAVYDSKGFKVSYSYIDKNEEVTLPESGYLVFIGEKGVVFQVEVAELK